jgi:hypothetical protein
MAAISGKTGKVNSSGDDIKRFTVNFEKDNLDSSHMGGGGYKGYTLGLIGASATVVSQTKLTIGSTISLNTGANIYSGTVTHVSDQVETPVDGLVTWTQQVNFDGSITVT